ncbi:hypothetical protein VNO80_16817 [Phaseolus coccineus]|uniref:Uncharacterized protein n=1 Tax=Phaseolus coccineus TaxID=3886 RepID=A0AAN9R8C7_PHACN
MIIYGFPHHLMVKMMTQKEISLHMMMRMMILVIRAMFSSCSSLSNMFPGKEKHNDGNKALVSQLLQGVGINVGKENDSEDWLDIVATPSVSSRTKLGDETLMYTALASCTYSQAINLGDARASEFGRVLNAFGPRNIENVEWPIMEFDDEWLFKPSRTLSGQLGPIMEFDAE